MLLVITKKSFTVVPQPNCTFLTSLHIIRILNWCAISGVHMLAVFWMWLIQSVFVVEWSIFIIGLLLCGLTRERQIRGQKTLQALSCKIWYEIKLRMRRTPWIRQRTCNDLQLWPPLLSSLLYLPLLSRDVSVPVDILLLPGYGYRVSPLPSLKSHWRF